MANLRIVKSPRTNIKKPFYLKVAYLIGYAAYYVDEFLISIWFKILVALTLICGMMRIARISIEIVRAGKVLLTSK